MPRAKKDAAAEAVEKVKAVAEDAKATVKAAAESVAECFRMIFDVFFSLIDVPRFFN